MVLTLKVQIREAEKWKKYLVEHSLMDEKYRPKKENDSMYYPLIKTFDLDDMTANESMEFVDADLEKKEIRGTLKDNLKRHLSDNEFEFLQTAHDIIGTIAILEIPEELKDREKIIAETLLKINPLIKTVLKKATSHEGTFRTQKMTFLVGEDTKEAMYRENGVVLKLNVEDVYFSARLSNERLRVANLVQNGEDILVMFSGCAPYPLVLSKKTGAKHILGIEINPQGHKYGLENIKLNKIKNIDLICGDVREILPQLKKKNPDLKFDRILMPLPKTADEFLDDALRVSKKGTVIHFYDFLDEKNFDEAVNKINTACKNRGLDCEILNIVKCGQHAPHIFRICVDFKVL